MKPERWRGVYGNNWKHKALAAKRVAGFRCQYVYKDGTRCMSNVLLDCHHITYKRLRSERGSDLLCLCRVHHMKAHGRLPCDM